MSLDPKDQNFGDGMDPRPILPCPYCRGTGGYIWSQMWTMGGKPAEGMVCGETMPGDDDGCGTEGPVVTDDPVKAWNIATQRRVEHLTEEQREEWRAAVTLMLAQYRRRHGEPS